ncbi:MAG: MFS transporter [Alphaproteobacteria bacterium]|nr:MFS transporter [Alphaproteobacteria bacterium]
MIGEMRGANQWKVLIGILLALWGLVHLQRFIPGFLSNYIIRDFGLTLTQFGLMSGLFIGFWAVGGVLSLFIFNRYRSPPNLIMVAGFVSILSWASGAINTFIQLVAIRSLIGLGIGMGWLPITNLIGSMTTSAHRNRLLIFFFAFTLLVGGVIGAPLMTHLAIYFSWRGGLFLIALPLIILSFLLWRLAPKLVLPNKFNNKAIGQIGQAEHGAISRQSTISGQGEINGQSEVSNTIDNTAPQTQIKQTFILLWHYLKTLFTQRDIIVSSLISITAMGRLFIIIFFGKLYLMNVLGLGVLQASNMIAISLMGDLLGGLAMAALAWRTGRYRMITLVCAGSALVFGLLMVFQPITSPVEFALIFMFLFAFFGGGILPISMIIIPLRFAQADEVKRVLGTIYFCAEFFGGAVLLIVAGIVGDLYGLPAIMALAAALMVIALVAADKLTEKAPPITTPINNPPARADADMTA